MNPKITIVGRLGKDPEAIGQSGTRFTVATNDRVKNDKTGQWEDRDTSWWTIKAWKTLGQQAMATLKKGQEVIIVGTIYQESWKDSNGNARTSYEVNAESIAVTTHTLNKDMPVVSAVSVDTANDPWATVNG
jgi:single-strand DNA-binding protein